MTGARQLRLDGGQAHKGGESDMFMGSTVQVNNILDYVRQPNRHDHARPERQRRSSTTNFCSSRPPSSCGSVAFRSPRMDLSGYGASIFSDWLQSESGNR